MFHDLTLSNGLCGDGGDVTMKMMMRILTRETRAMGLDRVG